MLSTAAGEGGHEDFVGWACRIRGLVVVFMVGLGRDVGMVFLASAGHGNVQVFAVKARAYEHDGDVAGDPWAASMVLAQP